MRAAASSLVGEIETGRRGVNEEVARVKNSWNRYIAPRTEE